MNNLTEKEEKAVKELIEGLKKLYGDNLSKDAEYFVNEIKKKEGVKNANYL